MELSNEVNGKYLFAKGLGGKGSKACICDGVWYMDVGRYMDIGC